jgi:uncharacterized protein (DUF885 family)
MKLFRGLSAFLAGAVCLLTVSAKTPADASFETLANACIDDYLRFNPETATQLGDHRFDGQLTDYSAAHIQASVTSFKKYLAALDAIDANELTGPNRVDAKILKLNLEAQLFTLTELKPYEWDVLSYNSSLADSLYLLTAREFAPVSERLHNAALRMAAIPTVVAQAKANLVNPPEIYTQTAIKQVNGAIALVREGFEPLLKDAPALRAELAPAQEKAAAALTDYKSWLEKDLLPRSRGNFRIGADHFRKYLRFILASDLSPEEILARAEHGLEATTQALYETALPLHRKYFPEAAPAVESDQHRVIKEVLDHLAQEHPDDDTVVDRARETLRLATDFVRSHDLVTVPDTPIKVIVTPEFKRGRSIAYCDSPGALEPNGETFVAIEPTPSDWTAARRASFFREYNIYMLNDLIVHEAMPGHYLQLAHSNQFHAPTLVRAVFQSGTFVEGWAVYTERMMAESGFGGPETRMQQLKMRLRVTCNAILDQKIHMAGMTREEALDLMMKRGFQEEGEAVAKWQRAQLSYGQLSTYFVGTTEHDDMRAAAEKKMGASFNLKQYNDLVTSVGSPAVKFVREEVGL